MKNRLETDVEMETLLSMLCFTEVHMVQQSGYCNHSSQCLAQPTIQAFSIDATFAIQGSGIIDEV